MKARGVLTVFVQSPQNPLRAELYAERLNAFRDELTKFAADRGALYWDFNDDMDLKPEDFQDTIHLGTQRARRQFQNLLVAKLAELLHERFASGG
ncbi:MAG TPA: hypothetical protein VHB21_05465, partial [Minicystis sp.]|nr:hypothetical protein [Minicystis sp.]